MINLFRNDSKVLLNGILVGTLLSEELNYRMSRHFAHFKRGFATFEYNVVSCMKN